MFFFPSFFHLLTDKMKKRGLIKKGRAGLSLFSLKELIIFLLSLSLLDLQSSVPPLLYVFTKFYFGQKGWYHSKSASCSCEVYFLPNINRYMEITKKKSKCIGELTGFGSVLRVYVHVRLGLFSIWANGWVASSGWPVYECCASRLGFNAYSF